MTPDPGDPDGEREGFTRREMVTAMGGLGIATAGAQTSRGTTEGNTGTEQSKAATWTGQQGGVPGLAGAFDSMHVLCTGGVELSEATAGFSANAARLTEDAVEALHADDFWTGTAVGTEGPPLTVGLDSSTRWFIEQGLDAGFRPAVDLPVTLDASALDRFFASIPERERFVSPDGSSVENPGDLAARTLGGDLVETANGNLVPSIHAAGVRDLFETIAADAATLGAGGLKLDLAGVVSQRDFSTWARAAFTDHLRTLGTAKRDELGVENPGELDPVAEIERRVPTDGDRHPATDPLYREFVFEHQRAVRSFVVDVRSTFSDALEEAVADEATGEEAPVRDPEVVANVGGITTAPESIPLVTDAATRGVVGGQRTVPPVRVTEFASKLAAAVGDNRGVRFGSHRFDPPATDRFPATERDDGVHVDALAVDFAESIANGCVGSTSLTGWRGRDQGSARPLSERVGNWVGADGSVPTELIDLTGFAWATREILRAGTPAHDVAVVVSVPTLLWQRAPAWGRSAADVIDSAVGTATVLRRESRAYDVLVFRHPELSGDGNFDRLAEYEQVILPSVSCLSAAQRAAVREFLDDGGHLVVTGDRPSRTANFEPADGTFAETLESHPGADLLDGAPGRAVRRGAGDGQTLARSLESRPRRVAVDADPPVGLTHRVTGGESGRGVVQLVNYDLDPETGVIRERNDVRVSVSANLPFEPGTANLLRPGRRPESLEIDPRDGRFAVTVPLFGTWGVVVFGSNAGSVGAGGQRSLADDALRHASTVIESAFGRGRHFGLEDARQLHRRAGEALFYGTEWLAQLIASQAVTVARRATRPPVIGIDTAHGQSAAGHPPARFAGLSDRLPPGVRTVRVTEWTPEVLDGLDGLVVPPPLPDAGFTTGEADVLEAFVTAGGGVLVLGDAGVDAAFASVLSRFDVEFNGRTLRAKPPADRWTVTRRHVDRIDRTVGRISGTGGTTVTLPTGARTLFAVASRPESVLVGVDDGGEDRITPATDRPITGVIEPGAGAVVVHGDVGSAMDLDRLGDATGTVLSNAIRYLYDRSLAADRRRTTPLPGTESGSAPSSPTRSPSGTATPPSASPDSTATAVETHGFGPGLGACAFALALAWQARRRRSEKR